MLYQVHLAWTEFELTTLLVIGTDRTSSYMPYTTIRSRPLQSQYDNSMLSSMVIMLAQNNNSPTVDMSFQSDALFSMLYKF
jgi:hypothetical protein